MRSRRGLGRLLAAAAAALVAAACSAPSLTRSGGPSGGRAVLSAGLAAADQHGVRFTMTEQLQLSGGTIPSGQVEELDAATRAGALRQGVAAFDYSFSSGARGAYQAVVDGPTLFVRKSGGGWQSIAYLQAVRYMPAVRLDLLRQTVLLSPSVPDPTFGWGGDRPVQSATVPAAVEQVAEFLGYTGELAGLDKAASADVHVELAVPGGDLRSVAVHVTLKDPASGATITIDNRLQVESGRLRAINVPAGATPITSDQLFQ